MNKIDTEYKSLTEIPRSVVQYYSEDVRTRIIGYVSNEIGETSTPITEEYTVIVLNRPEEVHYCQVAQRISERKPRDVVDTELARAIEWEEFYYGHDLTIDFEEAYALWENEQPTQLVDEVEVLLPSPVKEDIDLAHRREFYEVTVGEFNQKEETLLGYKRTYDDAALTALDTPITEPRDPATIIAENEEIAISTRFAAVYAELPVGEHFIDIGKGKDGIFGISNVTSAINAYNAGLTDMEVVNWIMTDNEVVPLTIDALKGIVVSFSVRKQEIFTKYAIWRAGDRLTPFSVD